MTPENFAYWLQGFFEISGAKTLDERQVQEIKNHLDLVFTKVTPTVPKYDPGTTFFPYDPFGLPEQICATGNMMNLSCSVDLLKPTLYDHHTQKIHSGKRFC